MLGPYRDSCSEDGAGYKQPRGGRKTTVNAPWNVPNYIMQWDVKTIYVRKEIKRHWEQNNCAPQRYGKKVMDYSRDTRRLKKLAITYQLDYFRLILFFSQPAD